MSAEEIIADVKNYLDITWDDADGDKKLTGIIDRGMAYINGIAGQEQAFHTPCLAQSLLFNYCRYERANLLEDFQNNYRHELLALQVSEGVSMCEAETTDV
jgi:hypothetical protein